MSDGPDVARRASAVTRFPKGLSGAGVPEAQEGADGWLTAYLDMITLVLTFFVVLLAFSDFSDFSVGTADPDDAAAADEHRPQGLDALLAFDAEPGVHVRMDGDRVTVSISDHLLFASGEAGLTAEGEGVLDRVAVALRQNDHPLSVEGHTDSVPIATSAFPSNWELSAARAAVVLRRLAAHGVARERMRAVGYADTRAVASNASEAGRALNRRVGLVVYAQHADPDLDPAPPGHADGGG